MNPDVVAALETDWRSSPRLDRLEILSELLPEPLRGRIAVEPAEFSRRPTGLNRSGAVVALNWPSRRARIGVGIETPIAHAFVDLLLGDQRPIHESRLQVTPVEWGVLTYLAARTAGALAAAGPWDFKIDRVSPDPFDTRDLGPIVGVSWRATVGPASGAIRLWFPASLLDAAPATDGQAPPIEPEPPVPVAEFAPDEVVGPWTAVAGAIPLPRGAASLRVGRILPLDVDPSPRRPVRLIWASDETPFAFEAEMEPASNGARVRLRSGLVSAPPPAPRGDVETAAVELGWVYLTGAEIAKLGPGDELTLEHDEDSPVSLTVDSQVVARGALIRIEDDLGVRLTEI